MSMGFAVDGQEKPKKKKSEKKKTAVECNSASGAADKHEQRLQPPIEACKKVAKKKTSCKMNRAECKEEGWTHVQIQENHAKEAVEISNHNPQRAYKKSSSRYRGWGGGKGPRWLLKFPPETSWGRR